MDAKGVKIKSEILQTAVPVRMDGNHLAGKILDYITK